LSRLHLLVRLLGLTGLVAALIGLNMAHIQGAVPSLEEGWNNLVDVVQHPGENTTLPAQTAYGILGGLALLLLALVAEIVVISRKAAFRRSASGLNAAVQVGLAVALLIGVNWFSFRHYTRIDCTRDRQFTLPAAVEDELRNLRGETTIVILQQRRKTELAEDQFGDYDAAAEGIVIEKVRDLAEQLRQISSQRLKVVILDARRKEFRGQLDELTKLPKDPSDPKKQSPLRQAIETAPENSLIFYAKDDRGKEHVQRLSFDAFLQLDKTASRQANDGNGNLVLLQKGVEPILRRVINLEERRPRVGLLVCHTLLSSKGKVPMYTAEGLGRTLANHGFDVRDIVLKSDTTGDSAVATPEEMRVEELRDDQARLAEEIPILQANVNVFKEMRAELPKANLAAFSRKYARRLRGAVLTDEGDRRDVLGVLDRQISQLEVSLEEDKKRQAEVKQELSKLNVEAVDNQRRMADLRGKLTRLLSDCDLVILPRFTRLPQGPALQGFNEFYRLDDAQLGALKDFLKSGKPMLACLGPINDPDDPDTALPQTNDKLENLLAQLGIYCAPQTILFDTQIQDFAEQRRRRFQQANISPVPEIDFPKEDTGSNELAQSLRLTSRLAGSGLDIRLSYPRPIYFDPDGASVVRIKTPLGAALAYAPVGGLSLTPALFLKPDAETTARSRGAFLLSSGTSWNDDHPFPTRERPTPQFKPPDLKDPAQGTLDEKRRGPFPLGVAVETTLPEDWYSASEGKPKTTRVVVIGSGNVFVDPALSPARQKLLLDSCNWLLGRDDLLNREAKEWRYPRLGLTELEKDYWFWGAQLWLPVMFAFAGLVVLLVRRAR
jgi:hypothetical protein